MKLPITISRWIDTHSAGTNYTYGVNDEMMSRFLLMDLMKEANRRISSYIARRYIEKNRDRIEKLVKHSSVRRHIEREIRKLLEI